MSADQTGCSISLFLTLLTGCVAMLPGQAQGAEELPDLALLEYLGSWEDSDEDWVLFNEEDERTLSADTDSDSAAEGEDAQESDDER